MTVVDATSGLAAAQARMAQIQSAIAGLTATATPQTQGAAGSDFASVLAGVQGGQDVTATGAGGTAAGQQVVDIAKQYLGLPYVYGSNDPSKGLDCSGLVQVAYRRMGIDLPRVTYDQVKVGQPVDRADLQPGDLVFSVGDKGMRVNGHVGIYAGNGMYVVAPHTGDVVKLAPLPKNITAIRRVLPSAGSAIGGGR
ncbi:MAG TPA: C40 family peptidase [Acidimicrobiia bacterium]|nr:C40 family peptidase [Acidimicrobiia bacterium]